MFNAPFKKPLAVKLFAAATGLLLSSSAANAVTLQDLFAGDSIIINHATFSNWQLDPASTSSADYSLIDVEAFASGNSVGLRYKANGQLALADADLSDSIFSYTVSTGPGVSIIGNELELSDFSITGDGGSINIIADLADPAANPVAQTNVFADNLGNNTGGSTLVPSLISNSSLLDSANFTPLASLHVDTFVILNGDFPGDQLSLNSFEQRFNVQAVPEPAMLGLFAVAGVLFAATRRPHPAVLPSPVTTR